MCASFRSPHEAYTSWLQESQSITLRLNLHQFCKLVASSNEDDSQAGSDSSHRQPKKYSKNLKTVVLPIFGVWQIFSSSYLLTVLSTTTAADIYLSINSITGKEVCLPFVQLIGTAARYLQVSLGRPSIAMNGAKRRSSGVRCFLSMWLDCLWVVIPELRPWLLLTHRDSITAVFCSIDSLVCTKWVRRAIRLKYK